MLSNDSSHVLSVLANMLRKHWPGGSINPLCVLRGEGSMTLAGRVDTIKLPEDSNSAQHEPFPATLNLLIKIDGEVAGNVTACRALPDGTTEECGYCFLFNFPKKLPKFESHSVQIVTELENKDVGQSPIYLEPFSKVDGSESVTRIDVFGGPQAKSEDNIVLLFEELKNLLGNELPSPYGNGELFHSSSRKSRSFAQYPHRHNMELVGSVDDLNFTRVWGWVQNPSVPDEPLWLIITDKEVLCGRILANRYRRFLEEQGIGDGRHGFEFEFPGGLSPYELHEINIRTEVDGADIPGSPRTLGPSAGLDNHAKEFLIRQFSLMVSRTVIIENVDFLTTQLTYMLSRLGQIDGKQFDRQRYFDFVDRWRRRLPDAERAIENGTAPKPVLRALVVADHSPSSERDTVCKALVSHIQSLQRLGYEIVFAAANQMSSIQGDAHLQSMGIDCSHSPYYVTVEELLLRQANCFDLIYLHRVSIFLRYIQFARTYCSKAKIIYCASELHHVSIERQGEIECLPELRSLAQKLKQAEVQAAASADVVITHSRFEANLLAQHVPATKIHIIPWYSDLLRVKKQFRERADFAFFGNYNYAPHLDALHFLISEVMPLLLARAPDIRCLIAGRDIPKDIKGLCVDNVQTVEHLSNVDIFEQVRLTVLPLAFGGGISGEVLNSLASGIPCVCSSVAAEGFDFPESLHHLVADGPEAIAASIHNLHSDEEYNILCSQAGYEFVAQNFSSSRVDNLMKKILVAQPSLNPSSIRH